MPTFEFTSPDKKRYVVTGPEGATQAQAFEILQSQIKAGTAKPAAAPGAGQIPPTPRYPEQGPAPAPSATAPAASGLPPGYAPGTTEDNMLGKLWGATVDPALTLATGTVGGVIGNLAGLGKSITGGNYGTQEGVREGKAVADRVTQSLTFQPRTITGQKAVGAIGTALNDSGIVGIPIPEINNLARAASSSTGALRNLATATNAGVNAADDAARAAPAAPLRDLFRAPAQPAMAGGGAAMTREAAQRQATAAQLPVPIKLTRGQRSRNMEDQRFEGETAKDPKIGEPLRNRTVEQNQQILQNIDAMADLTGSELAGLRPVGKVVDAALVKRVQDVKGEVNRLYREAADSAEGATPAPYADLEKALAKYSPEADTGNAPIVKAVQASLKKLDPEGTGTIPLRDYNEVRELASRLGKQEINAPYAKEIKTLVDNAVEANGGPAYRSARRAYENFSNEFKNVAVMDKLLRAKPGSKTRAVAYEDIVDTAILRADSLDSVRAIRNTLTKAGDEGKQAWRELQGETLRQIKERVTKSSTPDQSGARNVSASELDKIIREMDADGRLDFVFTKKGAQQLRDLNDIVAQVKTVPAGTVNTSNTATVLAAALDSVASASTGLPLPLASGARFLIKRNKEKKLRARVDDALNPDGGPTP